MAENKGPVATEGILFITTEKVALGIWKHGYWTISIAELSANSPSSWKNALPRKNSFIITVANSIVYFGLTLLVG